uniref:Zinc finger and BTB domain containing 48 n=1 Tax=Acanthochromis polyacanthus TaxID=80966 RepID=A0A3Q1EF14_9TELE
ISGCFIVSVRVLSSLNQQRAVGRFCDATLSVGGGVSYLAHRNVLACFSELFQRSNMPTSPSMELCLQGCPDEGLELLLNFVYTGELKLGPDNLEKVQQAATSLCIPEALRLCQQYKETSVDPVPVKRKRGRPRKSASDHQEAELLCCCNSRRTPARHAPQHLIRKKTYVCMLTPMRNTSPLPSQLLHLCPRRRHRSARVKQTRTRMVRLWRKTPTRARCSVPPATNPSKANTTSKSTTEHPLMCLSCRRHTGERPFGCLRCGKRYFRKENLLIHEMRDCARMQVSEAKKTYFRLGCPDQVFLAPSLNRLTFSIC